jgi:hypothetical protein
MFTDAKGNQISVGIKPRNWGLVIKGRSLGTKSNTAGHRKARKLGPHERHVEGNPNDKASAAHLQRRAA